MEILARVEEAFQAWPGHDLQYVSLTIYLIYKLIFIKAVLSANLL